MVQRPQVDFDRALVQDSLAIVQTLPFCRPWSLGDGYQNPMNIFDERRKGLIANRLLDIFGKYTIIEKEVPVSEDPYNLVTSTTPDQVRPPSLVPATPAAHVGVAKSRW